MVRSSCGLQVAEPSTFKTGSYGNSTVVSNPTYSFVHQATLPNAQTFQIRVVVNGLAPNTTVSGFSTGIYLPGGTQVAKIQNANGSWPSAYGYSSTFSLTSNSQGQAIKDLTVQIKPGTSGSANLRLRSKQHQSDYEYCYDRQCSCRAAAIRAAVIRDSLRSNHTDAVATHSRATAAFFHDGL